MDVHGSCFGMLGTFDVIGEGLLMPGIDILETFPLVAFVLPATLELANSL